MAYKDVLNEKLLVISYHLTTEQLLNARVNRNWDIYDKLTDVEKMQYQLEEFEIYEDLLEGLTEEDATKIIRKLISDNFK